LSTAGSKDGRAGPDDGFLALLIVGRIGNDGERDLSVKGPSVDAARPLVGRSDVGSFLVVVVGSLIFFVLFLDVQRFVAVGECLEDRDGTEGVAGKDVGDLLGREVGDEEVDEDEEDGGRRREDDTARHPRQDVESVQAIVGESR